MANFYCEYCGDKFSSISNLTSLLCARHPNGPCKGKHKLYEGSEKPQYFCKYCGTSFSSIRSMTSLGCPRHPDGPLKGRHAPTL